VKVFSKLLLWNNYTASGDQWSCRLGARANAASRRCRLWTASAEYAILLSSSVTVTIAHHALSPGTAPLKDFPGLTFLLALFGGLQRPSTTRPIPSSDYAGTGIYGSRFSC